MLKEAKIASVVSLFPLPQYVVVLEDVEKTRLVPIWIGVNEGNAIALEMQGEKFPRPLTHDLLLEIIDQLDAKLEKVVIEKLQHNTFYATLHLSRNGDGSVTVDARPSDSVALALRAAAPIYAAEEVMGEAGVNEV